MENASLSSRQSETVERRTSNGLANSKKAVANYPHSSPLNTCRMTALSTSNSAQLSSMLENVKECVRTINRFSATQDVNG